MISTAGVTSALGSRARGGAARLRLAAGWAGFQGDLQPITSVVLSSDARWLGMRIAGVAEPRSRAAEAIGRLRLGARGGTALSGYAEARTERAPVINTAEANGQVLLSFYELGAYDREGLTTGAELVLGLSQALQLGGGGDADPIAKELLAVRAFARYRHVCGCVAVAAFASERRGRGGFDAGVSLDLMP